MDSETKITFSTHELVCLLDTDFLLTKRAINDKVQMLFMQLAAELAKEPTPMLFPPTRTKVAKGENYRGLPYWVLDYPAIFQQEHTFAYRSICRWGHEFSFTLHLSGKYYEEYTPALIANYQQLAEQEDLYLCINPAMWEHHFEEDNYMLFNEVVNDASNWEALLAEKAFVKLAFKMPLEQWDEVVDRGVAAYRKFNDQFLRYKS